MGVAKKQKGHGDTSSDTAVSLKKGDFTTPPVNPIFQKENGSSEIVILRRKAEFNGLVVSASTVATKKKRADKPFAYRLCVCASDSFTIVIFKFCAVISVSCLHLGQYRGKFMSIVSPLIFKRVLLRHTGHNTH